MITTSTERRPPIEEIVRLYRSAKLYRPVQDPERLKKMYAGSPLVVTAWDGEKLVGILRGWTDGVFDGYVCDLAVDGAQQKKGIGRILLGVCLAMGDNIKWILSASVIARDYYGHLGWKKHENAWYWPRDDGWREEATAIIDGAKK